MTTTGRVIAIAVMLVGIGFVAVLTGAVAERFLASEIEDVAEAAAEVEATEADVIAEIREVRLRLDRLVGAACRACYLRAGRPIAPGRRSRGT